ncbi:MAG TPA: LytTR family DNA-binding domain-containing protein [Longimicrobium sp.]|nr:LytTR family DNA-binding domain-containing protein [Longimicrobium sp.]
MSTMIRALIVDDEPPARRRLRALLSAEADVEVAGECGDGLQAVEQIRALRPDVVFLDVQMPEAGGFEVVEAVGPHRMPAVVFVTAYDEFALRAFEVHALDYLLKPYDRERFAATLRHVRARLGGAAELAPRLLSLLDETRARPAYLERIPVRSGSRIQLVPVAELDYLQADDNYVRLHTGGRSHLVRETLGAMEARLDPERFLRVHRSLVVNLSRITELEPLFSGEYVLTLRDGTRLTTGRSYRARLQEALALKG